ncbi:MAG: FtsX-like permease family protein [Nitrospirota bacterium]
MAWRETRAAWRHFLYFFVCIALGVGALVGVALFAAKVERAVTREARGLMAGDLEVRLSHPLSETGQEVLRSLAPRGIAVAHVSELAAMAAVVTDDPTAQRIPSQIVELKAVEEGYPFYGALVLDSDQTLMRLLAPPEEVCRRGEGVGEGRACYGAVVQESLLIRLGLSVGQQVKIGEAVFTITGVLKKEPDRVAGAFSLGPRVMVSQEGLAAAALVKPGSRVRERYLLKVPAGTAIEPLLFELRGRLARESARVIHYRDAQPQLKRFLDQLTRYLGLIGLTALFVGGIGVASSVQAFLREKMTTIAVLKTVGANSGTVLRTYLIQTLLLGTVGSLVGIALGLALQAGLPGLMATLLPLAAIELTATSASAALPILKGMAMGILTTLLFTLWPLLGVRDVRPAVIFRRDVLPVAGMWQPLFPLDWRKLLASVDRVRVGTALGIGLGLAGLAIWQAGSWRVGLLFIGALAAAVLVLYVATLLLIRVLRLVPGPRSLALRHAIGNLHRPGGQAVGVMVSVGIGVMVIVGASLLERSLVNELGENRPVNSPTFFFIDIQPDQREGFIHLLGSLPNVPRPELTPLVRSRLHALNGKPVELEEEAGGEAAEGERNRPERPRDQQKGREDRKSWYATREYVLTFLDSLPKDNVILKGRWWPAGELSPGPLVSVEEEAARNLGLDLGSTVEFEIQGATVTAEVSSIRKVDWSTFSTNFYMILSPGSLTGAPFTYVATVRVPPEQEVPLQQAVVAAFPNVTAINIGDVLDSFSRIVERLSLAIRGVALFCVLTGGIVMAAALAATRYRRLYESVILKALGATRTLVAQAFAAEYAMLGAVAGLLGILLASVLSWTLLYFVFELSWSFHPKILVVSLLLTVLLTLAVGFLSTFRLLGERPLAILRHE